MKVFKKAVALEGATEIQFETGRLAKQANGAVVVTAGETVLLCTVCHADPRPGLDFFPLTVEYREKPYAAGKIPGGFFKRPGRPTDKEIIGCRLVDRPMRPLFPEGFKDEVQLILSVLSYDGVNEPDVLAITGASAALSISDIPFAGPAAAVRVGYVDGNFVTNFSTSGEVNSSLDLIVAGTEDAITMVEAKSENVTEAVLVDALKFAHEQIKVLCKGQKEFAEECGKPKMEFTANLASDELKAEVLELAMPTLLEASELRAKFEISDKLNEGKAIINEAFAERIENEEVSAAHVKEAFSEAQKSFFRKQILVDNKRPDGRRTDEVRPLSVETGVLPRAHGSAVFTRGETQALGVVTLGISEDEQLIESLQPTYRDRFMLHYNFPPFSVGEARMMRGPGRREIGHGTLARKSLEDSVPSKDDFPYTVRIVSEILESNGSSSMATVCAGSLAMMDAGVPVTDAVAGIAMGLVMAEDNKNYAVLTDIQGWEDHYGDMDFKVAGTRDGVTALQMDIKIAGLNLAIMTQALSQAKEARIHILNTMAEAISAPRDELSPYAPRIVSIPIKADKIGAVIGPQGKVIRHIQDTTGVRVEIDDVENRVNIVSTDGEAAAKARAMVEAIIEEPEVGRVYNGKVTRVTTFGCFVEIIPGTEGLCHISQLDFHRVRATEDVCQQGDIIPVKLTEIDDQGRLNLSRKAALEELNPEAAAKAKEAAAQNRDNHRDRDNRGGGRDSRGGGYRGSRDGGRDSRGGSGGGGYRGSRDGGRDSRGGSGGRDRDGGRGRDRDSGGRDRDGGGRDSHHSRKPRD